MTAYSCRYAPLVIALDAIDHPGGDFPQTPACGSPAVFTTVVARGDTIRARTCAAHDAAFRADPGYRDSIRFPGPPT